MKRYYLYQWLIRLKTIETLSQEELKHFFPEDISKQALLDNLNFLEIIADIAIRTCEDKLFPKSFSENELDKLPSIERDYIYVVSKYLNESDTEKFSKNIQRSLSLGMSIFMYEQIKYITPQINELGRIVVLFQNYKELFKSTFGLEPEHIVLMLVIFNNIQKETRGIFNINENPIFHLLYNCGILTPHELDKFLSSFSISVKDYKILARSRNITNKTINCSRILSEFPILKNSISNNPHIYYIPLVNTLIYSISKTIFPKIYAIQQKAKFKGRFGNHFEDYVRELSLQSFGTSRLIECTNIVKEKGKDIAEFQLELDAETVLIIEAKAIYIDEEFILTANFDKLNKAIEQDLRKAYKQIHSCFEHIDYEKKFGIIVIMSYLPGLSSLSEYLKEKGFEYTSENITIMSIQEFETLIGNESSMIKSVLSKIKETPPYHKPNIIIETEAQGGNTKNPYLQTKFDEIMKNFDQKVQIYQQNGSQYDA